MITKKEVEHIAKLARLGLSEEEKEKFSKELSSVLGYVNKLAELNVKNIKPMDGGTLQKNITRKDNAMLDFSNDQMKKNILHAAPERYGDYFKVPSILE